MHLVKNYPSPKKKKINKGSKTVYGDKNKSAVSVLSPDNFFFKMCIHTEDQEKIIP